MPLTMARPMLLLSLLSIMTLMMMSPVSGFPSLTGGPCPSFPSPYPLNPNNLPPSIISALKRVDLAITGLQMTIGTPAVSVAIVSDQSVIWSKGYGIANATSGSPVTLDTIFRIGSVSKVFTAISTMMSRDAGLLHLDDEVRKYEPRFHPNNPFPSRRGTTFHQLATHLAGLPREAPCTLPCNVTDDSIYPLVNQLSYVLPPNTRAAYSNLGFAILGNIVANVNNMTYDEMITKQIVNPMRFKGTGPNIHDAPRERLAVPYLDPHTVCPDSECLEHFGWANPAGGIWSSARDLASLLSLFMRDDTPANIQGGQILDGHTIREMTMQRYLSNSRKTGFSNVVFELLYQNDYAIQSKGGDVAGYSTLIGFVQELKLGIVVLGNINEHASIYGPAVASILIPAFEGAYRAMEKPVTLPLKASAFVGTYASPVAETVNIFSNGNELTLFDGGTLVGLEWVGNLTFIIRQPEGSQASCFITEVGYEYNYIYFQQQGGNVVSFTMPGRIWGVTWKRG